MVWSSGARVCAKARARRSTTARSAVVGLVAALAVALLAACSTTPAHSPAPTDPTTYARTLEQAVNTAREQSGLHPLTHDTCAANAAASRAKALVGAPTLTHAPLDAVIADCGEGDKAAENLSRSERPPAEVVEAWLNSPGHAQNIKDPQLTAGAIACAQDGEANGAPRFLCSHVMLGQG